MCNEIVKENITKLHNCWSKLALLPPLPHESSITFGLRVRIILGLERAWRGGGSHTHHVPALWPVRGNNATSDGWLPFCRTVWYEVLSWIWSTARPPRREDDFMEWWTRATRSTPHAMRKGTSSLIMLTAWWIWKHHNAVVFDGPLPDTSSLFETIRGSSLGVRWCDRHTCLDPCRCLGLVGRVVYWGVGSSEPVHMF
jgi:hypothetical protein